MTRIVGIVGCVLVAVLILGPPAVRGATPSNREIHHAIRMGNLDRVLRILMADPLQAELKHGDWSPLHAAVAANDPDMVALLLAFEPDLEVVDSQGRTPLLLASEMPGRVRVMEVLLEAGANPLAKDVRGRAPLDLAARTGDKATMQAFVDHVESRGDLELQLDLEEPVTEGEDVDFAIRPFREPEMVPHEAHQTVDFEYEQGFRSITGMVDEPLY